MILIDGSQGEGGGQMIRSALALSMISGRAFQIDRIRGKRKKPGLLRQHLTALNAATLISSANVSGNELKSQSVQFEPNEVTPGDYQFEIGTAGSVTLVAQTIIPALMTCEEESTVSISGGTHNPAAPPFDFLDRCYLPALRGMGFQCEATLATYGFYPAGGGQIKLKVGPPQEISGIHFTDKVSKWTPEVKSLVSKLPLSITERENSTIQKKTNWNPKLFHAAEVTESPGPGNVVMIELSAQDRREMFTGFGELNVPAEQIARSVLRDVRKFMAAGVPVGPYLADQLMLPMSIAATHGRSSSFLTTPLSEHSRTHLEIIGQFLDVQLKTTDTADGNIIVAMGPLPASESA